MVKHLDSVNSMHDNRWEAEKEEEEDKEDKTKREKKTKKEEEEEKPKKPPAPQKVEGLKQDWFSGPVRAPAGAS